MTQTEAILARLEAGDTLTPLDALGAFGCLRLAARVKDLRKAGHSIDTVKIHTPSGKTVAGYRKSFRVEPTGQVVMAL